MAAIPARATINLDAPGHTISRHLYGHFAEHLGRCIYGGFWVGEDSDIPHEGGIRLDIVEALRALKIPNLRWPGGCFADEYHWRDGVGPRESRPRMINSQWGDILENNHFGTHEFLALCELLGAEPYVNGNVGSGTVREMSDWVEYLTRRGEAPMATLRRDNGREDPWRVPFWGIGNEPWGCGGNMRAEAYIDLARQYSTYCRDQDGNRLYRIAAGARDDDYGWTEAMMKAMGPLDPGGTRAYAEAISFHYYTAFGEWRTKKSATEFSTDDYYRTMVNAVRIDEIIRRHAAVMDVYDPGKHVGLVLDEWGTWWTEEPGCAPRSLFQQNTMRDALVAAVHFDAFHRHADRLVMANIAQTVNVLQAVVLTDPESGALVRTPTYHVFAMNTNHHDAHSLDVRLDAPASRVAVGDGSELRTLSVSASTIDRTATISLTNLDADSEACVQLDLRGRAVSGYSARILSAPSLQSHNSAGAPDVVGVRDHDVVNGKGAAHGRGLSVQLPPHSYVTVSLTLD